jgi:hypothetical protein
MLQVRTKALVGKVELQELGLVNLKVDEITILLKGILKVCIANIWTVLN